MTRFQHQATASLPGRAGIGGLRHCSDAQLIGWCLQSEEHARAMLLERYSGLIYSIAIKAGLNEEDTADVFQSVCLALLEGLVKVKDASKLSSRITTVTQRHCRRVKQRYPWQQISLDQTLDEVCSLPDDAPLPDESLVLREEEQIVRAALSMVDEPSRRLLQGLFSENESQSYQEIAAEMGLAVATIGPKRGRSLKKLEEILHELGWNV